MPCCYSPLHVVTNSLQDGEEEFVLDLEDDAVTIAEQPVRQEGDPPLRDPCVLPAPHHSLSVRWNAGTATVTLRKFPLPPSHIPCVFAIGTGAVSFTANEVSWRLFRICKPL